MHAPDVEQQSTSPKGGVRTEGRAWFGLVAAVAVAVGLGWLFAAGGLSTVADLLGVREDGRPVEVGATARDFSLPTADGSTVSLSSLRGRPVVINFWATWCIPCRTEMPDLEQAYRSHQADGLQILAVNLGEERGPVASFGQELDLTFPLLLDSLGHVSAEYGVYGLPTTIFVDRQGRVTHLHNGALSARNVDEQVARIVGR